MKHIGVAIVHAEPTRVWTRRFLSVLAPAGERTGPPQCVPSAERQPLYLVRSLVPDDEKPQN